MSEKKSFWTSLPGILTGIAAVIGSIAALYSAGVFGPEREKVASVEVDPYRTVIETEARITLRAMPKDPQGNFLNERVVNWSSSNPRVVSVSSNGVVTGRAGGTSEITATCEGIVGKAQITVKEKRPEIASVEVTPSSGCIMVRKKMQLKAKPKNAQGNILNRQSVNWSSSNPGVARVSPAGLVTGVAPGKAIISVTCERKRDVATISVTGGSITVRSNTISKINAALRDANGLIVVQKRASYLEDINGMKICGSSRSLNLLSEYCGITDSREVQMPFGETYEALIRGVCDAIVVFSHPQYPLQQLDIDRLYKGFDIIIIP